MTAAAAKNPVGRPSTYDEKVAIEICAQVAEGNLFTHVIRDLGLNVSTLYLWLHNNPEFMEAYAQAREIQADVHADGIVDIADQADEESPAGVGKARLQVDARKWVASKLRPKTWGDHQHIEVDVTGPVEINFMGMDGKALPENPEEDDDWYIEAGVERLED